jgi:NAD-dependent SIR2 family protein deacetylase
VLLDLLMPMQARGLIDAVISQNIDGLHLRSGLPPSCLYELHGNSFMERCRRCRKTHFRPFDVKGMSFKPTGRLCEGVQCAASRVKRERVKRERDSDSDGVVGSDDIVACRGALHDFMLDWGDALPSVELRASERLCRSALCLLCLGTSLYINPCGLLPNRTKKAGGSVAIVSLSATAQDGIADIVSRAEADEFMSQLCSQLNVAVPCFVPSLCFYVAQASVRASDPEDDFVYWRVCVSACSDGQPSPLPHLLRAAVRVWPCEGGCVSSGNFGRWTFEGATALAAGFPLRLSVELVWHSFLSQRSPAAAPGNDLSFIELELSPAAASMTSSSPQTTQHSGAAVPGLQQSQDWHRIGRYACPPAFSLSPEPYEMLPLWALKLPWHATDTRRRYVVQFPVENGAELKCSAAVELLKPQK